MSIWSSNLGAETAFWRDWLTKDEFKQFRDARLYQPDGYLSSLLARIGNPAAPRILDVGSGPISTFYAAANRDGLHLECADALGREYAALIAEIGIGDVPAVLPLKGEELTTVFSPDTFDLVHCANALDHCEDPAEAFRQMYTVCKPGGAVTLISVENEGERENYCGLHQWNLRADPQGLWLSSRQGQTANLLEGLPLRSHEWRYVSPAEDPTRIFEVFAVKT